MALGRHRKEILGLTIATVAECRKGCAAGHTRWLQKSNWWDRGRGLLFNARKLRQVLTLLDWQALLLYFTIPISISARPKTSEVDIWQRVKHMEKYPDMFSRCITRRLVPHHNQE